MCVKILMLKKTTKNLTISVKIMLKKQKTHFL